MYFVFDVNTKGISLLNKILIQLRSINDSDWNSKKQNQGFVCVSDLPIAYII
jgi:hypothetical protein